MTRSAACCANSAPRHLEDGLIAGALAHPDQHHAIADRHDVAALQRGRAVVHVRIAEPDGELAVAEVGWNL